MIEVVILKVGTPVALVVAAALAAIDPSVTNIVLALIALVGHGLALHYGYKTAALSKKLAEREARLKDLETPIKEKEKIP